MNDIRRIAALQWRGICRNRTVLGTHALALLTLTMFTLARIPDATAAETAALVAGLLLFAASGAPVSVGANVLVSERVRGTMEALLLLPVPKHTLLAGKGVAVFSLALAEVGIIAACLVLSASTFADPALGIALRSWPVLMVLFVLAPLVGILLTIVVMVASGRARDPQTASSLSLLVSAPVMAMVFGLWFGVLSLGPLVLAVLLVGTLLLCAVAFRTAVTLLSDETLANRRA